MGTLVRGKQIGIGADGIKAANVDTTEVPTLAANNVFTGNNTFTGTLDATGGGTISVSTPVSGTDAANKNYVDSVAQGLDWKQSVRASTGSDITLSGVQTIDGVAGVAGDRVLVKAQTDPTENGIYTMLSGSWTRTADADVDSEVTAGMAVFVEEGGLYGDSGWVLTTDNPISLGTDPLTFTQFSGAGSIIAGSGLSKTGNTLDVNVDNSTIEINSDTLRIKDLGVTTAKINAQAVTTGKIADQAVTFQQFIRGTTGYLFLAQGTGSDSAYIQMSGDASITNSGVLTISNLAVTTAKINNEAVTMAKLERSTSGNIIIAQGAGADPAYTAVSGDITLTNAGVATIANLAVTTAKLNNNAVTAAKIDTSAVGDGLTGGNGTALAVVAANDSINVSVSGVKAAVPTTANKIVAGVVTTADGDPATAGGDALAFTPGGDGYVEVTINGVGVTVGDGVMTAACYFSDDGGVTAKAFGDLAAGDLLYWVGSVAGYELDTSDTIEFFYSAY